MSKEKRLSKVQEKAKHLLEPDEQVRGTVWGQTKIPPGGALSSWMVILGASKPQIVVLTDRHLYIMRGGVFVQTSSKKIDGKFPLGTVPVEAGKLSIKVGDHPTVFVHPFHRGRAKEIAAAVQPGGGPPLAAGS